LARDERLFEILFFNFFYRSDRLCNCQQSSNGGSYVPTETDNCGEFDTEADNVRDARNRGSEGISNSFALS